MISFVKHIYTNLVYFFSWFEETIQEKKSIIVKYYSAKVISKLQLKVLNAKAK